MAIKGKGTKIYHGTAGAAASTALARVRSVAPPTSEVADIDISHLESSTREYTAGIIENGEVEWVIELAKATFDTLDALIGTDKSFKIEYADGSYDAFEGYIKSLSKSPIELDTVVLMTITIKISGAVTFTPAV